MKIQSIHSAPTLSLVGDVYHVLLAADDTGGTLDLIHGIVPPGGGPPLHTHTREDEMFFILEGELTFIRDGREITAGPGAAIYLERHVPHRFENRSAAPVRMLVQSTPSGLASMMREAGHELPPGATQPLPVGAGDVGRLLAAAKHAAIIIHE